MSILTASIAEVKIGIISIEGLMDEKGEYAVGVPQIAMLFPYFQDDQNQAAKKLKRLMGIGFKTTRYKTEFNRNVTLGVSLSDFKKVLRKLDKLDDVVAVELTDALVDLTLHQLFCDAFGVKFDADDRQAHLIARMNGKVKRRDYTDAIADYLKRHTELSDSYVKWIYSNVSDALNIAVFTKKAKPLCIERGCKREHLRDTHEAHDLNKLEHAENFAAKLIDKQDKEPLAAMKEAIAFYFE